MVASNALSYRMDNANVQQSLGFEKVPIEVILIMIKHIWSAKLVLAITLDHLFSGKKNNVRLVQ